MSDTDDRRRHSFARFRVTTERMRDGRAIQFYEWPDDPPAERSSGDSPAQPTRRDEDGGPRE